MKRTRICPADATAAVFVEGGDDERSCAALMDAPERVFWMTFDGRDPAVIRDRVAAAQRDPGWARIRHVAVVLDAEDDVAGAAHLARAVLDQVGGVTPAAAGVVSQADQRRGWFLLPDNRAPGALESLLRRAAPDAVRACVDQLFVCTPNPGTTVARADKAWVAAWLAAATGNPRVDQIWSTGAVRPTDPAFAELRRFLADLTAP